MGISVYCWAMIKKLLVSSVVSSLLLASSAMAETTVKLSGVHLCCGGCVKGIGNAVKKVEGAAVECDKNAGSVTIKANDDATARKALGAIGRAGYYGKSDNDKLAIRARKAKDTKVTDQKVAGLHLCCGACVKAVNKVVDSVDGATGHDAAKGAKVITVKGTYSAAALQKAFQDAGLNGRAPGGAAKGKGKGKGGKKKK